MAPAAALGCSGRLCGLRFSKSGGPTLSPPQIGPAGVNAGSWHHLGYLGQRGPERFRAKAPYFPKKNPPASVYTMCGELPHGAARVPPQSWGDVGRTLQRGEVRTRVCYPHKWHQSISHAHGVLCAAGLTCPHGLRAVRAAHPSAPGPVTVRIFIRTVVYPGTVRVFILYCR